MRRYISNYTILSDGEEVINHITTVDDEGKLISIMPFDRELGNTVYVPAPLCIATASDMQLVKEIFEGCKSRQLFKQRLATLKASRPKQGDKTVVLRLNFALNSINQI